MTLRRSHPPLPAHDIRIRADARCHSAVRITANAPVLVALPLPHSSSLPPARTRCGSSYRSLQRTLSARGRSSPSIDAPILRQPATTAREPGAGPGIPRPTPRTSPFRDPAGCGRAVRIARHSPDFLRTQAPPKRAWARLRASCTVAPPSGIQLQVQPRPVRGASPGEGDWQADLQPAAMRGVPHGRIDAGASASAAPAPAAPPTVFLLLVPPPARAWDVISLAAQARTR